MDKELCVRCNQPTPYDQSTPITLRLYYVEGSGQLCQDCFEYLYPLSTALESYFHTEEPEKKDGLKES